MGRATVDLPDATENAKDATPTTIAGADDLLAQLAGDEIDRLLAESDIERDGKPTSAAPAASISPTHQQPDATVELDVVMNELQAAPVAKPVAPAESPAAVVEKPAEAALAPAVPSPPVGETVSDTTASDAEAEAASAAERAALDDEDNDNDNDNENENDEDLLASTSLLGGDERELSPLLKPLAWLSAPLDAFPDAVREALGKVAILTLVNAIAVLAYVMLFRRHQ
jgi:hypothetical protein